MKNEGRIALSSLAVSVSAASFLAVSGVAWSDPPEEPEPYCHTEACGLGNNPHSWDFYTVITGWNGPYAPIYEGTGVPKNFYEDVGACGYDTSSPEVCSCIGWKGGGFSRVQEWYGSDPWGEDWTNWHWVEFYIDPVYTVVQEHPECWRAD